MYKRRFSRFPRRKIICRKKSLAKKRVPKSIKRYVKKAIHRNIENKEMIAYTTNQSLVCTQGGVPLGTNLILAPTVGTADHQRIGNCIKLVRGVFEGRINIVPYDAANNPLSTPVLVKMFVVRHMGVTGSQSTLANYAWSTFFRSSGATNGFTNSPLDLFQPINTQVWRVLMTRTYKIGAANATTTGKVGTGGYFDNSPMSVGFKFNYAKYCRKVLKFSEEDAYCKNDNLIAIWQCVMADGSSTTLSPAEVHYCNTFVFEDA